MEFRTPVKLAKAPLVLTPESRVVMLGSCFAEAVGEHMRELLPEENVALNPFGVLYNPESVRMALELLLFDSFFFPNEYIFQGQDGLWHSWLHSTHFSSEKREECVRRTRLERDRAAQILREADLLCVTFGTNRAFEHRERGFVVGNCHKELPQTFVERRLGVAEIVASWEGILQELARINPKIRVLFTVSPYRYAGYGLHESQLAKAVLLLAVDELCEHVTIADYFPAYEIILDELRDYRFFAPDMLHPSAQASDYVWETFAAWTFTSDLHRHERETKKKLKAARHRSNVEKKKKS